jgi:hypothetical protein
LGDTLANTASLVYGIDLGHINDGDMPWEGSGEDHYQGDDHYQGEVWIANALGIPVIDHGAYRAPSWEEMYDSGVRMSYHGSPADGYGHYIVSFASLGDAEFSPDKVCPDEMLNLEMGARHVAIDFCEKAGLDFEGVSWMVCIHGG